MPGSSTQEANQDVAPRNLNIRTSKNSIAYSSIERNSEPDKNEENKMNLG